MARFILRYTGGESVPANNLKQIRDHYGLTVLDDSMPKMILVQATPHAIEQLTTLLPNWVSAPEQFVQIPDGRPKLKKQ